MSAFVQRTRVLKLSLVAILSAFVVELAFGLFSNSLALITDSIHALLDAIVTIVLLLAARMALKPPDAEHTYGHGKIESLGGLIGGIAILLIAVFFIIESLSRAQKPPPDILPGLFAVIAGIYTIGADMFRIVILRRSISRVGGATLKADFYHALMDLGSTMVAIAGIVIVSYGFYYGDFAAALILGVLLAALSTKLIYNSAMDLTDTISPEMVARVRGIVAGTQGVVGVGPVLMRKSGDVVFADVTVSLRADTSFEGAHEISSKVEDNIRGVIENSAVTIHFEPTWDKVPIDPRIGEIASRVDGVKEVHNISSYRSEGRPYVSLHVMVDGKINLEEAHKISERIEEQIRVSLEDIEHVTIHLEPYIAVPHTLEMVGKKTEDEIRQLISEYREIKKIGRIVTFNFKDVVKIDIDCSFEKSLPIENVHDLTTEIERKIRGNFKNAVITIHPEPI